ncbi:iron-sulfur cluster assembly scaffold protein [Modicisalibacter tunisiensis]|uniref:Iron-sulfur cluster assembly scaffold protein n=2 Tax=Modicisalibacter TaxID=574347 RepID=A0ABS7X2J1_9GAMM|nr:iron-sulfur cluster assembly scaffold protein [Modicisalibacter tunisiensis]MBZ9537984.1 iron-sulfur cluster assembly scaffold protein [Modicisalibacter tunisiensis]MBZ9568599.1 iron-sulfur cluster assembly scaffold protein [Modicisalibacter tunisiensis]
MNDGIENPDFILQLRKYSSRARRDRRLQGGNVRTITLTIQSESKDSVTIDAVIEDGIIQEVGYRVRACSLAQATTALVAERAAGLNMESLSAIEQQVSLIFQDKPPDDGALIWPELMMLQNAAAMPSRHEVAFLPFQALKKLLSTAGDVHAGVT